MDELDRELTKKARHDSTMPERPNNFDEPEVAASAEIETTSTKSSDCDATQNLDSAKLKADFEESEEERREWQAKGYTLEAANDKLKEALKKVNGTQASISSKQSQEAKNAMRKFENDAKGK